jgi:hypothetical protein
MSINLSYSNIVAIKDILDFLHINDNLLHMPKDETNIH